jgi:signal peptidase I
MNKDLSLHQSKKIFHRGFFLLKKCEKKLPPSEHKLILDLLVSLEDALKRKDQKSSSILAQSIQEKIHTSLKRNPWEKLITSTLGIVFALFVAILIRQMWFEPYNIPTGSMRPTLRESDVLVVTKTPYGINTPLRTGHFYFDEESVKRGDISVFSAENLDLADTKMMYFYVIPGVKQFVKRLIAKPGDTIYFYGGKIYGIDRDKEEILDYKEKPFFNTIEHIPFIRWESKIQAPQLHYQEMLPYLYVYQMNEPLVKLENTAGHLEGKIVSETNSMVHDYYDFWGFQHFASARLLTPEEVHGIYPDTQLKQVPLYLELTHHPSIQSLSLIRDHLNRLRPSMKTQVSLIPLDEKHLARLQKNLYTCRFHVKNCLSYSLNTPECYLKYTSQFPILDNVPDGTYEFFNGTAYRIYPLGISVKLPLSHPLYEKDYNHLQTLFNLGMEFNNAFMPLSKDQDLRPARYAYFRDHDLYVMGKPLFNHNEPELAEFLEKEIQNHDKAFVDRGPPLKEDGSLDKEFIQKYGLVIPDKMYLMLGDNHAQSADSREFGFVPESNLRGKVGFLVWPFDSRFGFLPQNATPWLNFSSFVIYCLTLAGIWIYYWYRDVTSFKRYKQKYLR